MIRQKQGYQTSELFAYWPGRNETAWMAEQGKNRAATADRANFYNGTTIPTIIKIRRGLGSRKK